MLIYDPARDPYHSVVRLLAILGHLKRPIEIEAVQIIDLLLMFPALLLETTLPRGAGNLRKLALDRQSQYRQAPQSNVAIDSIKAIQSAAASTLAAAGLLSIVALRQRVAERTSQELPAPLAEASMRFMSRDGEYRGTLVSQLAKIPLSGRDGLKMRTKLGEYRYDAL
jgi:hypothetical protein